MPTNCVVGGCTRTTNDKEASFYRFPSKSKYIRQKWIQFVRGTRKDFIGPGVSHNDRVTICNAHFEVHQFVKRYEVAKILKEKGQFSSKLFARKLVENAIPTLRAGKVSKPSSSVVKRLSRYCQLSETRVREREASILIRDHEKKEQQELEQKHIPTVENASEVLQRFALMAKPLRLAQDVMTPSGFSVSTENQSKCNQSTQVYIKPFCRSKAVNVHIHCGKNKGIQTKLATRDASTQYEAQTYVVEETEMGEIVAQLDEAEEEDKEEEEVPDDLTKDPDYNPLADLECNQPQRPKVVSNIETHREEAIPHVEPKYVVFESCLLDLFLVCPHCNGNAVGEVTHLKGSMVVVKQRCVHKPNCGFTRQWYSQPFIADLPAGNLMLSAAILFAGASPTKVLRVLSSANIACISYSTFIKHQRVYLQPAIMTTWEKMRHKLVEDLQEAGQPLVIGGDARNDSPGHTAKFGSYTFMELNHNKILHVELVQKNEVANSYNMELEALKRGISWMEEMDLDLGTIITDRHVQVRSWIKEQLTKKQGVKHYFDVWHISKGIKKKLRASGMKKDCQAILPWIKSITNHLYWVASSTPDANPDVMAAKWLSMVNHVMNVHVHNNTHFTACTHAPLNEEAVQQKAWIFPDTKAADELEKICESTYLLRDVKQMSPGQQTSCVEAYHGTINYFAPKLYAYSYTGMLSRLCLAAMHFNENSGRAQREKNDGTKQWSISFPRGRDGDYVLRKVLKDPTYGYVHDLFIEVTSIAATGVKTLRDTMPSLCNVPPSLSTSKQRPTLEEALQRQRSRYANIT